MSTISAAVGAALAILRPSTRDQAPVQPAREALDTHLEKLAIAQRQIAEEHALERQRSDKLAQIEALRGEIDRHLEDQRYRGVEVDLKTPQRALLAAERDLAELRPSANVQPLLNEIRQLGAQLPRLKFDALMEQLAEYAPTFRQAEQQLRATHRHAFALAIACDRLAKDNGFGVFGTSKAEGAFNELFITRPALEGYSHWPSDPAQAEAARVQAAQEVSRASDEVERELMHGPAA